MKREKETEKAPLITVDIAPASPTPAEEQTTYSFPVDEQSDSDSGTEREGISSNDSSIDDINDAIALVDRLVRELISIKVPGFLGFFDPDNRRRMHKITQVFGCFFCIILIGIIFILRPTLPESCQSAPGKENQGVCQKLREAQTTYDITLIFPWLLGALFLFVCVLCIPGCTKEKKTRLQRAKMETLKEDFEQLNRWLEANGFNQRSFSFHNLDQVLINLSDIRRALSDHLASTRSQPAVNSLH